MPDPTIRFRLPSRSRGSAGGVGSNRLIWSGVCTVQPGTREGNHMAEFDVIIRGGTVATGSDVMICDVGVRSGSIAALGLDLGTADKVIDARGKLVLPGGIDSHVHIAQPSGPDI